MVIERKGGRTFSLRVLLRANFVFLFSKFSSVLCSLHTVSSSLRLFCSLVFSFNDFVSSPVGYYRVFVHGGVGHREDALFGGTNSQSCVCVRSGVVLVDS